MKRVLDKNMPIQHLRQLADTKKNNFEKSEMKQKYIGVRARRPFLGAKVHSVRLRTPV